MTQTTTNQPEWGLKLSKYFIIPQRLILSIMGFFAILNAYTMRVCLSTAITEIVKSRDSEGGSVGELVCGPGDKPGSIGPSTGVYEWSESLQGIILSSFYWGYVVTHIPGGLIADKFGGKWILALGILTTSIFTILTPLAIHEGGANALIILRVLMGLGEGTTFPALSVLLSQWVPLKERSKLGALVLGGGQVGTIMGNAVSGIIMDTYSWDVVFYVFGGIGLLWSVIFVFLCYDNAQSHPFIKPEEREFLIKEIGTAESKKNLPPTPWIAIMTSAPMLALICAQIGHDWGFYIMVTDLPKYMSDVLHFSIKENGLYSSLPYLTMWLCSLASGVICDWMIKRDIMGITWARKFFTTLAAIGPAFFIVGASYAGCDRFAVVALFTVAMGLMGGFYAGMKLNPLDLSPNYSGTLMAITNGIGAITGIVTPYLVGVMTPNATLLEWRLVFWIAFAVLVSTSIVYVIWASGEVQPWNDPQPSKLSQTEEGKKPSITVKPEFSLKTEPALKQAQ